MIALAVIVCILGGIVAILASREKMKDDMLAWMGKWSYLFALIAILWFFGGMKIL